MKKSYLLATACNEKYENFLVGHWLKSLRENVNLGLLDILVLDFGLTQKVRDQLLAENVILKTVKSFDGHINTLRFMELADYLSENPGYEQVILCDSGDIIFQRDISEVFQVHQDKIKGVCEEISPNMDLLINDRNMLNASKVRKALKGKRLVNAGFVVYPVKTFLDLVDEMKKLIRDKSCWGVDMVALNYFIYQIYQNGFAELPLIYNFIPTTTTKKYFIKEGKFFLGNGELIAVVHNAGGKSFLRPIRNFGYGKEFNKPRRFVIYALRSFYVAVTTMRSVTRFLKIPNRS